MIGTIRTLGTCPCPLDSGTKKVLDRLGTRSSRQGIINKCRGDNEQRRRLVKEARDLIYDNGYGIRSKEVERRLSDESWVPTLVSLQPSAVQIFF